MYVTVTYLNLKLPKAVLRPTLIYFLVHSSNKKIKYLFKEIGKKNLIRDGEKFN